MSVTVKDFMINDLSVLEDTKEITFPQFASPITIRSLNAEEMNDLRKNATVKTRNKKTGQIVTELDQDKLVDLLMVESIKQPDLKDANLQEFYGTPGNAGKTLRKMLKAGQYDDLATAIQELNGYEVNDLVEEIKN